MFCQLAYLRRCIPGRIRHALEELPRTLDETYARILEEIDEQNWEYAHRLLQCVAAASRPLCAEELAEFLAFEFKAGSTPRFLVDWRPGEPEYEILSICSTLLVVVNPHQVSPVIQFAHFSVKEYLTSSRLAEAKNPISRFHVCMTSAHTIIAQACLCVLLHLDDNITKDDLKGFPLAEYAAKHWVGHARIENVSSKVQDEMERLFDPSKNHLSVWGWIFSPFVFQEQSGRPAETCGTPLHYAAAYNILEIATSLIVEHPQDVNSRDIITGETPLAVSCRLGHVEFARVLLEHGADTEALVEFRDSVSGLVALRGDAELAELLLDHHADATAPGEKGCTPLYLASKGGHLAIVQVLLTHGADVATQSKHMETPLHVARKEEVARLLLAHGADPNALNINNQTPLHRVSELGHTGVARVLLENGVDPNARDAKNATPLHLASYQKYKLISWQCLDVARLLLQWGSDIRARDDEGQTPFMIAADRIDYEMMQLLLEHINRGTTNFLSLAQAVYPPPPLTSGDDGRTGGRPVV